MPREKKTRNPLGTILPVKIVINGKNVTRFHARRRYTKPDGSAGQKFRRCVSLSEAAAALVTFAAEIKVELEDGPVEPRHTFFELCSYFESEYIKPPVFSGNRVIGGYRQNLQVLRGYVAEYKESIGDIDLRRVTYEHVRRYAERLAITPVKPGNKYRRPTDKLPAPATLNRKLSYLRRILNVGIQLGWLDRNPFNQGKKLIHPGAEQPRERALTIAEEELLLRACDPPDVYSYERRGKIITVTRDVNPRAHLKPVIIAAIETGLRKRELFTTRRSQVDFAKHVLTLNPKQTKALKKRYIVMSERLENALIELFNKRQISENGLIFGGLIDCDKAFATACRRAGLEGVTFHTLRHSANTNMDLAGLTDGERRNLIGHESVKTGQIYINLTDDSIASSRVLMREFREKRQEKRRAAGSD